MINSRDKGAEFEREVAAALHKLTGIKFETADNAPPYDPDAPDNDGWSA